MSGFKQSDLWFGSVVFIFFAAAFALFFGKAVTDPYFWQQVMMIVGFTAVFTLVHRLTVKLDEKIRYLILFVLGFGSASVFSLIREAKFDWLAGLVFGLVLMFSEYISNRQALREQSNG